MSSLVLTLLVCLAGQPCTPDDRSGLRVLRLPWDGSLHECVVFGQLAALQWAEQHGIEFTVVKYRCGRPEVHH